MGMFDAFMNPPWEYTLVPFWFLNDDLSEEELKRQIDDFEAHGVYGFIPHARLGLPESIGFMSDAWLHFTKVCVDYAAEKGMIVVLYDEGMYPSGSCAGQVVAANPRHATRCIQRRETGPLGEDEELVAQDRNWIYVNRRSMGRIRGVHYGMDDGDPGAPPSADLLNPNAMACFRRLVLDRHYEVLKEHFGKTIRGVFTDEPAVLGRGHINGVRPWTWGFETFLQDYLGYDFRPHLAALFDRDYPDRERYVGDFYRAVNARLEQAYYAPYTQWCEDHGVALTGHPAGPDDIGMLKYFQVPGQDVVWRYIEPFAAKSLEGPQSTMAKCSASAQRHYGRARNTNECFGAYGWEFTYDEMRWITNWLLVRGVNQLMPHAFYYSLRGDRRNERPPDVGPNSPWWDRYKTYAYYCRRLCWLLAQGRHVCQFAVLGSATVLPWRAARVLFEAQRDFNYLDCDTLRNECAVSSDAIRIRDMTYKALIIDGPHFVEPDTLPTLKPLLDAGRVIAYVDPVAEVPAVAPHAAGLVSMLDAIAPPDVVITPPNPDLRYIHMRHADADLYLFANEGREPIDVALKVAVAGAKEWWDPEAPAILTDANPNRLALPPYETRVLCCTAYQYDPTHPKA